MVLSTCVYPGCSSLPFWGGTTPRPWSTQHLLPDGNHLGHPCCTVRLTLTINASWMLDTFWRCSKEICITVVHCFDCLACLRQQDHQLLHKPDHCRLRMEDISSRCWCASHHSPHWQYPPPRDPQLPHRAQPNREGPCCPAARTWQGWCEHFSSQLFSIVLDELTGNFAIASKPLYRIYNSCSITHWDGYRYLSALIPQNMF